MPYLCYLPSLLFGIAVSAHDVRTRRIPRAWIACGVLCQLVAFIVAAAYAGRWEALAGALTGMVAGAGIQLALALIRPGAVGLGDVTLCALVGAPSAVTPHRLCAVVDVHGGHRRGMDPGMAGTAAYADDRCTRQSAVRTGHRGGGSRRHCVPGLVRAVVVLLVLLHVLFELVVVVGELGLTGLEVRRHEVQPIAVAGVHRRLDGVIARIADWGGR